MFQLLELFSRSILIEILNNTIQQESGIHGVTEKKKKGMTCYFTLLLNTCCCKRRHLFKKIKSIL